MSRSRLLTFLLTTTLVATVVAPTATAQQPGGMRSSTVLLPDPGVIARIEIDTKVLDLVARLGHDRFSERDAATRELETLPVDRLQLYAVLQEVDLTVEQRHRLLSIVRHRLINMPRGAIGISMDWLDQTPELPPHVKVRDLIPDLPAEQVLEIHDRILAVDGVGLTSREDLVNIVQRRPPGATVRLSVMRPQRDEAGRVRRDANDHQLFEAMEVDVALGSAKKLNARSRLPQQTTVSRDLAAEADGICSRYGVKPTAIQLAEGFRGSFEQRPTPGTSQGVEGGRP
ncbi:MAG: PDZ domain-containing protein [Planctomycetota bacterium]